MAKKKIEAADAELTHMPAQPGMIRRKVVIRGTQPILMNKLTSTELNNLYFKNKKPKNADVPSMHDHAESRIHINETGHPIVPKSVFMSCLIDAGRSVRLDGKKQISTATGTKLTSFLALEEAEFLLKNSEGKPAPWVVSQMAGRNATTNAAVCVVRPQFNDWEFECTIQIFLGEISERTIRELFDRAGRTSGLFDFRPNRKGTYGTFVVNEWIEVK